MSTTYAYIEDGRVRELIPPFVDSVTDPETPRDVPLSERYPEDFVAHCVAIPANVSVALGDSFVDGMFGPPPPPPTATPEQVLAERSARMSVATTEIEPLRDLVDLGEASEEDEAKLTLWVAYRAKVSKVQTQPGYPGAVVWPEPPAI